MEDESNVMWTGGQESVIIMNLVSDEILVVSLFRPLLPVMPSNLGFAVLKQFDFARFKKDKYYPLPSLFC